MLQYWFGLIKNILEEIKDLPFDYYQVYDCTPAEIKSIIKRYKKKIIVAITVKDQNDVVKYLEYNELADIVLFDSKGYEKSISFDHQLINNLKINKELMLAGNIQIEDNLENYKEIARHYRYFWRSRNIWIKRYFKNKYFFKQD